MWRSTDKLAMIIIQGFGLMDDVSTWTNDLVVLQIINRKWYKMLLDVYKREQLDKINSWIEKIQVSNKVFLDMYKVIQDMGMREQANAMARAWLP